jgi:DNA primase
MASVTDRPSTEQLCEQIKALVPVSDYVRTLPELRLRNLSFRCPNASAHKHGDKNPSAAINHTQRSWNCKACGAWGSVIDIYRYYYQVSSSEAIRAMAEYAGLTPAYGAVSKPAPVRPAITPKPDETPIVPAGPEVQRFLVNAQAAFREHPGAQAYVVETRGIPLEVAIAAGMGYAPRGAWLNWWGSRQPRVIVPLTTPDGTLINLYGRSTVNCDKALKHSFLPGSRGIFNAPALATEGVVLVEGVFDALTVLATHHPAAAIMGLSIRNQWWTEIGARVLLLAADDDEPGRKRQTAIAEAGANLARKVIYCPKPNYLGGRKDFNDFWLHVERRLPKSLDTFYEKKLPAKLAELAAQTAAPPATPSECPAAV